MGKGERPHFFSNFLCSPDKLWYNSRRAAIMLLFQSFFSPLMRQPKKLTHYTIPAALSWYNHKNDAMQGG